MTVFEDAAVGDERERTMSSQAEQIADLRAELDRAHALFDSLRVRPSAVLLDQTVARFLWWTIADAELVLLAVEAGRPEALSPVLRHLFETTHDVIHLVSVAEEPEAFAAGSLVAEVLDWAKQAKKRRALVERTPRLAGSGDEQPLPTADEAFREIVKPLEELGQDTAVLDRVYAENRDRPRRERRVHCTGLDRISLIEKARSRLSASDEDYEDMRVVCDQLAWLWRETSARGRTHSSPGWLTLRIEQDRATGRMGPGATTPQLRRAAAAAAGLLNMATNFVGGFVEDREAE